MPPAESPGPAESGPPTGVGSADPESGRARIGAPRAGPERRATMNVLVTGGAGYVGSIATEALLAQGHRVVVVDDLRTGHRDAVPEGAAFVLSRRGGRRTRRFRARGAPGRGDPPLRRLVAGGRVDAPRRSTTSTTTSPGALWLWRTALRHGVRRVVVSSTAALYGTPDDVPIPETARLAPESVYGETKLQLERALQWLATTAGVGSVALRYFNAAGASRHARRGPPARDASDSHRAAGGRRTAAEGRGVRRRLPDARRDRRARLCPRRRPRRRPREARSRSSNPGRPRLTTWATARATRCAR
jgi:nucleoside-diphosphate-sugar epimerase